MKMEWDKINITNTIAVVALSLSLIYSVVYSNDTVTTTNLASGLIGFIGGHGYRGMEEKGK